MSPGVHRKNFRWRRRKNLNGYQIGPNLAWNRCGNVHQILTQLLCRVFEYSWNLPSGQFSTQHCHFSTVCQTPLTQGFAGMIFVQLPSFIGLNVPAVGTDFRVMSMNINVAFSNQSLWLIFVLTLIRTGSNQSKWPKSFRKFQTFQKCQKKHRN